MQKLANHNGYQLHKKGRVVRDFFIYFCHVYFNNYLIFALIQFQF